MTTNKSDKKAPKTKKTKKKKGGPIRYEAIVPTLIVFALFFTYFRFFFDGHLRRGIEFGATYANGAEVNIRSLKTSFFDASLEIRDIEVTDKAAPTQNVVQIGSVDFKALWDGLLRGKVVVPLAAVKNIMINTPRKRPGRVLPVKKSSESQMQSLQSQALAETQKVLDGNILGDVADVLQGTDYKAKLKEMEGQLKSSEYIKKLQAELKVKEQAWKERLEKLPKKEEFKAIEERAKAIKVDGKDPASILRAAKEVDALYKDVDAKVKMVKESKDSLNSDLKQYKNLYGDLKAQVDQDLNDLGGKLGLPSLDPKDLAMRVFGRQFASQIQRVEKYMRVAREYMPPPKSERTKDDITPREREVGKNYKFPKTKGYPLLWIQKTEVSSKSSESGFSGDISGVLLNITTEPRQIGLPMEAKLSGQFPNSNIYDVVLHAIVDYTTDNPKETGLIKVGAFPLKDVVLSDSSDVKFGFSEAKGSSDLKVELQNENLQIDFNAGFDKIAYLVDAKSKKVQEILTNVSNSLGALTVQGRAGGTWKNLDLSLRSNLGERLQDALKNELNAQVAQLKQKLRAEIEGKVAQEKEKLLGDVKQFEDKYGVSLKSQEDAMNSLKAKLDEEKKKATSKQTDKLKDAGKDLLKKFKFK